jgi:hypothetical protein
MDGCMFSQDLQLNRHVCSLKTCSRMDMYVLSRLAVKWTCMLKWTCMFSQDLQLNGHVCSLKTCSQMDMYFLSRLADTVSRRLWDSLMLFLFWDLKLADAVPFLSLWNSRTLFLFETLKLTDAVPFETSRLARAVPMWAQCPILYTVFLLWMYFYYIYRVLAQILVSLMKTPRFY